jgi:hypothetical protein
MTVAVRIWGGEKERFEKEQQGSGVKFTFTPAGRYVKFPNIPEYKAAHVASPWLP